MVGNRGYRRYLKGTAEHFAIDEKKVAEETRYDGKWVLQTNLSSPASEVARQSKEPAPEWADIVLDLENLEEAEVEVDGKRFRIRSEVRGAAVQAFRACGVALPPLGRPL